MIFHQTLTNCHKAMTETLQCPGMNILQHGESVHEKYLELLAILKGDTPDNYGLPP